MPGVTIESNRVEETGLRARVGGRLYTGVIRVQEFIQPEGDVEYKLYAPGVGVITEYPPEGRAVLRAAGSLERRCVLIVEDDVKMAALVRRGLSEEGAAVDVARSGEDALWMAASTPYDAIVLDVMLPGIDGFETCRRLRDDGIWTPVLLLTARDAVEDRVAGLDGGADDYLTKPFSFAELSARLRALVRRGQKERPAVLEVGDLRLDPATRQAWRGDAASSSPPRSSRCSRRSCAARATC